ncbi:phosphatidylglycerol lysyltransferase domain-containing protein [Candidatus Protochlamydia amoebophila]|uniref:Phosphatidylglycerol lysyltransferase C-terminal domain-containing protein n=2 Tax=Candidatus Protochlamydia amoebophila TaxID=362787 RepID=Q6MCP4_PARUW|nr:phosphatidylglycerol lysyltransferase domain-containing protein [Candidatus Protochlamydia amoebophila]KIC72058.1 hypothetical protein DB44_CR00100 [Candidatus Protochlamydia amoebophila]CAF23655.1 unnamed protein product [Candidatus Protochlamydia amoebophila UWE25]
MTAVMPTLDQDVDPQFDALMQVRRFGGSCSEAILDPRCQIFTDPFIDGLIGYRLENSRAIVYGDPVCQWEDTPLLIKSFTDFCHREGYKNIIYVITTEKFCKWAMENVCHASVEFGHELFMDPHDDPRAKTGVNASLVRRKVRHAQKEAVVVEEYIIPNLSLEAQIEEVAQKWLKGRRGPQIYISRVHLFDNRAGKRWFYAKQGEKVTGVVVLNELQSRNGWLINRLMHIPGAANGTPEFLLTTVIDTLAKENCHYVTFGAVTTGQLGKLEGLNSISKYIAELSFKFANRFFHLDGKMKFWEKFDPKNELSYLLFTNPSIRIGDIWALMHALNIISK